MAQIAPNPADIVKRRAVLIVAGLAVAALVGGGGIWYAYGSLGDGWTRAEESKWTADCTEDESAQFCDCLLDAMQRRAVTYKQINTVGAPVQGFQAYAECHQLDN